MKLASSIHQLPILKKETCSFIPIYEYQRDGSIPHTVSQTLYRLLDDNTVSVLI